MALRCRPERLVTGAVAGEALDVLGITFEAVPIIADLG